MSDLAPGLVDMFLDGANTLDRLGDHEGAAAHRRAAAWIATLAMGVPAPEDGDEIVQ